MDRFSRDELRSMVLILDNYLLFLSERAKKNIIEIEQLLSSENTKELSKDDFCYVESQYKNDISNINNFIDLLLSIQKQIKCFYQEYYYPPKVYSENTVKKYLTEHESFLVSIINTLNK